MNHLLRRLQGSGMAFVGFLWLATNSAWAQDRHAPRPTMAPAATIDRQTGASGGQQGDFGRNDSRQCHGSCFIVPAAGLSVRRDNSSRLTPRFRPGKKQGSLPLEILRSSRKIPTIGRTFTATLSTQEGRVVRAGVSARIDSAPSGSHYEGAPMFYFMRLTSEGVGMHIGILPGYPASHGCIRMPAEIAPQIYAHVKIGTPVQVIN